MAKLERYIGQLVEDQGRVDDAVLENIVADVERSSRVKSARNKVSELKSELSHKEKQIATLRKSRAAEYTLKLAEEKEALAARIETLVAESSDKHRGTITEGRGQSRRASSPTDELKMLRAQNMETRKEVARLRATLDLAEMGDTRGGRGGGHGNEDFGKKKKGTCGARYYEGQAVECRRKGSDSWYPATIESARLTVEPLGRSDGEGSKTYMYSVYFDDKEGSYEHDIPESRLRRTAGVEGDDGPGQGSSWVVKNSDGETVVRSRVFGPGDAVLVRSSGSGSSNRGNKKWIFGEVIRRNDSGTYRVVVLGGPPEGKDFHAMMLRAQDHPADDEEAGYDSGATHGGMDPRQTGADNTASAPRTKASKAASPAEEAETQYANKREELLRLARASLPATIEVGQEVLAKNGGSTVWGPGIVVSINHSTLHCSVEFDFGDVEENIPSIFVRPRRGVDLASHRNARAGDAVLAQRAEKDNTGGGDGGRDWLNARFGQYDEDDKEWCYVVFAGEESVSRARSTRVRPLYLTTPTDGHRPRNEDMIPGNLPPPTKPVRAKKHHEGEVVLACIPKAKEWTPALITGVKGRGRYSVEWADGTQADSLLFMFIASMGGSVRKGAFAVRSSVDGDENQNESNASGFCPRGRPMSPGGSGAATAAAAAVRLRKRALNVGESVLAKKAPDHGFWSPGSVTRADGGGKYDVQFTDGTTAEDLSFLFVRALGYEEDGGDSREDGEVGMGDADLNRPSGREAAVGDTVYVLKRGNSPETSSRDLRNRDLWRAGTVTDAAANGRFAVQYNGEEGKPTESRIVRARIRRRNVIRQKTVQEGDAVLALSTIPGRGWILGTVTSRDGDGQYTIAFADGTESDHIRFVNLRRVVDRVIADEKEEDNHQDHDKPLRRGIRQRRFKIGELALAKHPESRKWVVVKVLEALPSGRYDLEFLGDQETPDAVGVPFQSIRHLDLARFGVASHDTGSAEYGEHDSRLSTLERASRENTADKRQHQHRSGPMRDETTNTHRGLPDESWDEHDDCDRSDGGGGIGSGEEFGSDRDARQSRRQRHQSAPSSGDDYDHQGSSRVRRVEDRRRDSSETAKALVVGSDVYVLRRGKSPDAAFEDKKSWRVGKVISARGSGTFGVEYDEAGAPKEDRITENRLRHRHAAADRPAGSGTRSRSDSSKQDETLEEGDVVLVAVAGSGDEQEPAEATVEAYLGDDMYRVSFIDGSGTRELELAKLRRASPRHAGHLKMTKRTVKKRKLTCGQMVLARKRSAEDQGGRQWQPAKVIKADGQGNYSVLFVGDSSPTSVNFIDVKSPENNSTEGVGGAAGAENNTNTTVDNKKSSNPGISGFLRVTAPSFDLSTTASAARRTSPCLLLATGERGDAEPKPKNGPELPHQAGGSGTGNRNSGDQDKDWWPDGGERGRHNNSCSNSSNSNSNSNKGVGFMTRSSVRPGSQKPAWKDGEFWLSLEGLQDPALFLTLEDAKKEKSRGGGGGEGVSEHAVLAEACIPLPLQQMRSLGGGGGGGGGFGRRGRRGSGAFEVELNNGAGVVSLQWSTHKDTPSMRTGS